MNWNFGIKSFYPKIGGHVFTPKFEKRARELVGFQENLDSNLSLSVESGMFRPGTERSLCCYPLALSEKSRFQFLHPNQLFPICTQLIHW